MLYDPETHVISGNGNRKGLLRFFPGLPAVGTSAKAQEAQHIALKRLLEIVRPRAKSIFGPKAYLWGLQPVEHTPCEWIKYRLGFFFYIRLLGIPLSDGADTAEEERPRRTHRVAN